MRWLGATLLAAAALTSPIKAEDAAQGAPESHAAGGGAQEMCLGSLADFLRFLPGAVRTCGHDRSLKFYGTGESGHWAVQANQQIAAALAILSETPDAELAAAGSPYTAAELSDLSLALFRYSLRTHRTGDIPCTDGRKWGKSWISVLGLERASGGIGIIERRMSEEDRRRLRDVLVFECDYRLNEYPIKAGIVENNVPESNLWNAGVMFRTASNYPDLPQAGDYAAKARKMMLNGLTRPSDSNETWYVGANFTDEWALDHHGYLNVGYMYESLSNLAFLHFDFLDRGRPEPAELMHNVAPLWEACKLLTFPDGRLCRIGGDTRVRHAYCQLFAMQSWALAAHALGDADALVYEREGIRRLRREQVAGTDGSYFGKRLKGLRDASWYYYCRLEADAALAVAYSLHWHRKGYLGESDMEVGVASDGSWYVPLHRATFLRGPKSYRSVCVRSQSGFGNRSQMPNIVCAPADRSDLAEWGANLVGAVGLQMECDEPGGNPERWNGNMFRERRYSDEGGEAFEQAFRIPVKDGVPLGEGETSPASVAERGMKVVAVGDGTTMAIRDTVVMTRTASLEHGYSIGRMVIPNDVLNGGSRRYEGDGTGVVTVDGALSLVSVNGGVARVRRNRPLTFQRPGQSRFMHPVEMHGADVIVLEGSREEPVLAEAGETLYDVVYLAIAGADAESARRVAASAKWDGPSERLVFAGTDGIERKLDMSVDVDAWPAGRDPESVSRRISEQFLSADPVCYAPVGSTVTNAISPGYGWNNHIFYATASMWVTALDNARQFGDAALESRLVGAFEPYLGERAEVLKPIKHVDFNVVGAVPLAIARLTGDERARKVGLSLADFQWREPSADDAVVGKSPMDERVKWWKQGYTDETRLWIDDMYMINLLQTEAYRLSGDAKYIDRAAKEMVLYLDRLQNADGLFYHAPDVPFVWGRGAGWMSGGMALVLKALPAGHPCRERILVGYRKMMARLLACQRDDGLWGQLVDDPASWSETSGSAMFAYGMAEGVANGWLDGGEYRTAVRRAWLSLTSRLDRYGNISGVCVGTNKKNDRQYYLDRPCLNGDPHGQAPMLWLAGAMERCRRRLQASGAIVPPLSPSAGAVPQLLIDTDMLTDCDDVAALELAFECERRGDADVLAITVSSAYPKSAPVVDAVATFCGRGGVPIGTPKNGTGHRRDDSCFLDRVAAEYPHGLESNDDAPDAVDVMRRTLARAEDASVTLVTLGYLSNVASLLKSGPDDISPLAGRDLVGRKVKEWVCMGGNFPNDPAKDNVNFTRDAEAAVFAITNYPGRITFVGREIGHSIFIGDRIHDLPAANPLRRAYELHRGRFGRNWDHHTADPVTILYAVYGQGRRFGRVEGTLSIRPDCSFSWNPANASNMSYLTQAEPRADTARAMEELVIPWTMAGDAPSARRPGALRSGPANSD